MRLIWFDRDCYRCPLANAQNQSFVPGSVEAEREFNRETSLHVGYCPKNKQSTTRRFTSAYWKELRLDALLLSLAKNLRCPP